MKFYQVPFRSTLPRDAFYPCFKITKDNWNDYGYYTLYSLTYYQSQTEPIGIGYLKILQEKGTITTIPNSFDQLSSEYCSLGGGLDYYQKLQEIFKENIYQILASLNDCAIDENIKNKFINLEGFKKSLLRSSEDEKTLAEALNVLKGESSLFNFNFSFKCRLQGCEEDHQLEINFSESNTKTPNRIFCIIGKNGTGKTQFLANLSLGLSGQNLRLRNNFSPGRPLFSKVIAVSYSLFDNFEKPKSTKNFNYIYCGIKGSDGSILSQVDIQTNLINAIKQIIETEYETIWKEFISEIIDIDLINHALEIIKSGNDINLFKILMISSGQSIILNIVSHILANISKQSLVIFDEPETHLHPNAISKIIKIIYELLEKTDSYAILATHSPIIIQQIPSYHIKVFDRNGNIPEIKNINIETFGENLTYITDEVFGNLNEKEYYKIVLDNLKKTIDPLFIDTFFKNRLSFNARIYFTGKSNEKT